MTPPSVATPRSDAPAKSRLLYIDNLRTVLIALVVIGHLAITYGGIGDWYYREQGPVSRLFSILALPLGAILMASLLGLFSFVAGYFTVPAYDRRGTADFLFDRVKRLAIPLAFYEVILNPVICYVREVRGGFTGSFWEFVRAFFSPLKSFGDGPVWFLEMLLIFSVLYAASRFLAASLRPGAAKPLTVVSAPKNLPGNGAIALFALGLGVATWVVRIWAPAGRIYEPWHQEPARYPQYIAMFVIGLVAYRRDWLATFPDAQARLWRWLIPAVVIALGGVAAAAGAFSGEPDKRAAGGLNELSLAYAIWEAWTCVAVSIVVLAWFRKRFNRQGQLARAMSAAAFGVYVLHPAVIVPLAIALSGTRMNLSLKFLWVTPIALALCFVIAHLLRKVPVLKNFL
jgi:glucan biosynthesis protein C